MWNDSLTQSQGDYFPKFPGACAHIQKRFEESHHQAFLLEPQVPDAGHAVEWTWGLVRDGRVLALLDGGGWMHDALGAHRNLVTTYAAGHDLRGTYAKHLAPML